jgi:ABC-type uncharacterized transport system involved in gliding motility auxiliary subunit
VNARLLKARQTKYAAYATVYVLVVLMIATIANVLANRHNKSFDSTANKRYSLSAQTAKIANELKENATITYFDQPKNFQRGKDLLEQYSNLSHKIHVEYVDVEKEPQLARREGITNAGTALVQVGNRKEPARSLTEEGVTGAFIRDLKNTTRTVCFVGGSGEHQITDSGDDGYSILKNLLSKDEYQAKTISLLEKTEIPSDCTVLAIGGPTKDYSQPEVDAIKKYVENGGRALFMLDPPFKVGKLEVAENAALTNVLQGWGVTLDKNLIFDLNPISQITGWGAQVALVTSYGSHPIVNDIKRTATGFPLARGIEVKSTDKSNVQKLFDTSETSFATSNLTSAEIHPDDPKNRKGPLTLAAAGTYNTGKENLQGRFVVVGSSGWPTNHYLPYNGNPDLALNTVNWLASDEDLISIRPKDQEDRRITLTAAQFNLVRTTSQFLLPLAVMVVGITVWWKRR